MLYKLIDSASFFDETEPTINVVHPENLNELTKKAADDRITSFVGGLKPAPGKIYIHINAMGAGEFWSSNKNGDFFPEHKLVEDHDTFETSPAHVFRHHINKDPARAIGKVLYSIFNPRMRRVELIAEVDQQLGQDIENRIAQGDYPSTSMACKTPYDVCSICNNKARTRQEYCSHLRTQLGQLLPDGRKVMAMNVGPLKFFDISIVIKPADVTSSVLQKVAFANEPVIGSAELAEMEGITDLPKQASFTKISDIIKNIEGTVASVSPELDKIIFKTQDPDHEIINQLKHFGLNDILQVLADLGISPSIEFLSELIARKFLGHEGYGLGKLVAQYIKTVDSGTEIPNVDFGKVTSDNAGVMIRNLLSPYVEQASLFPQFVEKRASIGYASFNPNSYEEPNTAAPEDHKGIIDKLAPLSKTLLAIGGAAILAKMVISRMIDEKLKEKFNTKPENNAKILIIKQASDYSTASMLSKYATAKEIKRETDKKNLDQLARATRKVIGATNTQLGGKLTKIIKSVQLGSKAVNKIQDSKK